MPDFQLIKGKATGRGKREREESKPGKKALNFLENMEYYIEKLYVYSSNMHNSSTLFHFFMKNLI